MAASQQLGASLSPRSLQSLSDRINNSLARLEKDTVPNLRAITDSIGGGVPRSSDSAETLKKSPDSPCQLSTLASLAERLEKVIDCLNEEVRRQSDLVGQNQTQSPASGN
jgi:hypothetical protein